MRDLCFIVLVLRFQGFTFVHFLTKLVDKTRIEDEFDSKLEYVTIAIFVKIKAIGNVVHTVLLCEESIFLDASMLKVISVLAQETAHAHWLDGVNQNITTLYYKRFFKNSNSENITIHTFYTFSVFIPQSAFR